MHRFILTLLVIPSVAIMIYGCGSARTRSARQPRGELGRNDSTLMRSPSFSVAEATNNPVNKLVTRGNAPTNSVFTAYDAKAIHAIQQHWYELLGDRAVKNGKVVIEFRLHADGRVTDLRVAHNTADEKQAEICQKAILQSAPFAVWPQDLRLSIADDYRDVCFTFYLN